MSKKKTHQQFLIEIKDRSFTVLEEYTKAHTKIKFKCDIDGHEWSTTPNSILRGHGCPECKQTAMTNTILSVDGDVLTLDISTSSHPDATMLIDSDVYSEFRTKYTGRVGLGGRGYPVIKVGRALKLLHTLILEVPEGMQRDHINGIRYDNRLCNLRVVTRRENLCNKKCHREGTTVSRYIGVCTAHSSKKNPWLARICINGKTKYLGVFPTELEAAQAYLQTLNELEGTDYPLSHITR